MDALKKAKTYFNPLLIGYGVFGAGFMMMFDMDSLSPEFTLTETPVFFVIASLLVAAVFIGISRRKALSKLVLRSLLLLWIACVLSVLVLLFVTEQLLSGSVGARRIAVNLAGFFLGASMPLGMLVWVLILKTLSLQETLFNVGFAFIVFSLVCRVGALAPFANPLVFPGVCLLLGTLMPFLALFKKTASISNLSEKSDVDITGPIFRQMLASVPIIGMVVALFVDGTTLIYSVRLMPAPWALVMFAVLGIAMVLFALSSFSNQNERQLSYLLFQIAIPALISLTIVLRVIPIEFIADTLFTECMGALFQLFWLISWVYVASFIRGSGQSVALICGVLQIVFSVSLLAGHMLGTFDYLLTRASSGVVISALLIFSAVCLGHSIILYNKGTGSNNELIVASLGVEKACRIISENYGLTSRETEVLVELAYGHAASYISAIFHISDNTVHTHMKNIYKKLNIKSRYNLLELVRTTREGFRETIN
jgi:DNA-binding CsgD family transcriptional regulator